MPSLTEPATDGPVEVALTVAGESGKKVLEHRFDALSKFGNCLLGDQADGPCPAPEAMAAHLSGPRLATSVVAAAQRQYSCADGCCNLSPLQTSRDALYLSGVCFQSGSSVVSKLMLTQTPRGPVSDRADSAKNLAKDFSSDEQARLRSHFAKGAPVQVHIEVSPDGQPAKKLQHSFASGDALVDCMARVEGGNGKAFGTCSAPAEVAKHLLAPRTATAAIERCDDRCCELAPSHSAHNNIILSRVCFKAGATPPTIESLSAWWSF